MKKIAHALLLLAVLGTLTWALWKGWMAKRSEDAEAHSEEAAAEEAKKTEDGKKEERVTFAQKGTDVYASRSDQPGALKVEAGKYDAAIKKLDSIQ